MATHWRRAAPSPFGGGITLSLGITAWLGVIAALAWFVLRQLGLA